MHDGSEVKRLDWLLCDWSLLSQNVITLQILQKELESILVLCGRESVITDDTTDWLLLTKNSLFLKKGGRGLDLWLEKHRNRIQFGRKFLAKMRNPCAHTGAFRVTSFGTNSLALVHCGRLHRLTSVLALKTNLMIPRRNFISSSSFFSDDLLKLEESF